MFPSLLHIYNYIKVAPSSGVMHTTTTTKKKKCRGVSLALIERSSQPVALLNIPLTFQFAGAGTGEKKMADYKLFMREKAKEVSILNH